jgi:ATP-dependent RNA helicase DDX49/DBP8
MEIAECNYPKRAKVQSDVSFSPQEASLGKFVRGLWEHIHAQELVDPAERGVFGQLKELPAAGSLPNLHVADTGGVITQLISCEDACSVFKQSNTVCRNVSHASRTFRAVEVIVQANWVEHFDNYAEFLARTNSGLSDAKCRKATLIEACRDFGWSEKELRNKMAIWRGYKEIKDAAGWAALVFAGMGLYRFCKYRSGMDKKAMEYLRELRPRIEVAADTLQPQWRQLLAIVGESTQPRYTGHPHDWAVSLDGSTPVSLASTYESWDPDFSFQHLECSVIDSIAWGADDPRLIPPTTAVASASNCSVCHLPQSEVPMENQCWCFPSLFGGPRRTLPVQVFRTGDGRRNGLVALVSAERGTAIGEVVGLVTRGIDGVDVMNSSTSVRQYQIWQGHQGNYTRFINHSCNPNSQFEHFSWMGTQHIILISKGIDAGAEITVDYSESYWSGLDKRCLCGQSCCRYSH